MSTGERLSTFNDRFEAQHFFAEVDSEHLKHFVDLAHSREVSEVAPDLYYSHAARAISYERLGPNGLPDINDSFIAFLDAAYLLQQCHTEIEYTTPEEKHQYNLGGTELELLLFAALCGARVTNRAVAVRFASAENDFYGRSRAHDLRLFTLNDQGHTQESPLQIKSGPLDDRILKYDTNKVIVVSVRVLAQMLPEEMGEKPASRIDFIRRTISDIGRKSALADEIERQAGIEDKQALLDELDDEIVQALEHLGTLGDAVLRYVRERPDRQRAAELLQAEAQAATK